MAEIGPRFEKVAAQNPINFASLQEAAGQEWVRALESLSDEMCRRWALAPDAGDIRMGFHGVVLPVRRGDQECVLKLTWPQENTVEEVKALSAWGGSGTVLLLDADTDRGAVLLERLDSNRALSDRELFEAAGLAGELLRKLAVPAPEGFQRLPDIARDIVTTLSERQERLGNPVAPSKFALANSLGEQLAKTSGDGTLVHADLHYGNVLAGKREPWLAIDPKPVAGDPEFAVPELMWTRADEAGSDEAIRRLLAVLVDKGQLDAERARAWGIVRSTDYWLWGLEHGLTVDPKRCERIIKALS